MGKLLSMMIACAALFVTTAAYAQLGPQKVTVGFEFKAGGKVLPAGDYEIYHATETAPWVTIRSLSNYKSVQVKVLTLLQRTEKSPRGPQLMFEKIGESQNLTQVWLPDQEGLLVKSTKGKPSQSASAE
jgi:hypothetical protein